MVRATTPTITITLPNDIDLSVADKVYITFWQVMAQVTKTVGDDGVALTSDYVISCKLSQEETNVFSETSPVMVQVNWTQGSNRFATTIGYLKITNNLLGVMNE